MKVANLKQQRMINVFDRTFLIGIDTSNHPSPF